jgi:phosphoribosylformylglycinamidine synthase subunit PurS
VARVVVDVMLKPEILDPAGQAVASALPRLGVADVSSVRIGKRVEIEFAGEPDLDRARRIAGELLANPVIEDFTLRVEEAARGAAQPGTAVDAVAGCDPVEPDAPAAPHAVTPQPLPEGTTLVPAEPVNSEPVNSEQAGGEQ